MKKIGLIVAVLTASFMPLIFAAPASAQATRTWVSGVGDDANPCSRTAPCKTFAGAITKTAAGGEINALDPGGFGAVTITQAVTIDGNPGAIGGILVAGGSAITVSAGANDVVTLRNLDINGIGTGAVGVRFNTGASLHIENSTIYGFSSYGVQFAPTTSSATPLPSLFMTNDVVRNNNSGGVLIQPTTVPAYASLDKVSLKNNPGFGLDAEANSNVFVANSDISGNTQYGVLANSSSTSAYAAVGLANTSVANNGTGISATATASTVRMSNVYLFGNTSSGIASGSAVYSFGNVANTWNGSGSSPKGAIPLQ